MLIMHAIHAIGMHIGFCKRLLGVHSKTTNVAVMGEVGRYPMLLNIICHIVRFWHHVKKNDHKNIYLMEAGKEMRSISEE